MKHTPQIECASHLSEMLTHGTADLAITRAIKLIKDLMRGIDGAPRLTFDSIACSGISGLLFAPPVARKLKKSLIIVRKRKGDHSHTLVEGDRAVKSYIILDDIVSSGATIERILGRIEEESPDARCLGFLGYSRLLSDNPERQKLAWRPASELDARGYSGILSRQIREDRAPRRVIPVVPVPMPVPEFEQILTYNWDGTVTATTRPPNAFAASPKIPLSVA